jgi:hypothetical protein
LPFGGDRKHKRFTLIQKQMDSTKDQIKHLTATDGKPPVSGSFGLSDYIKSLFEKNSSLQIILAKMNKKRARYALAILSKMQSELDILMDEPDEETYAEYQEAIRWMKNQILKRYSIAETVL